MGLIPGWGTKIPHAMKRSKKTKNTHTWGPYLVELCEIASICKFNLQKGSLLQINLILIGLLLDKQVNICKPLNLISVLEIFVK